MRVGLLITLVLAASLLTGTADPAAHRKLRMQARYLSVCHGHALTPFLSAACALHLSSSAQSFLALTASDLSACHVCRMHI